DAVIARVLERAEGSPLAIVELLHGLRAEGLLRKQAGSYVIATEALDSLPDAPLAAWLAQREIERLGPDVAAHARLASLLAPEFFAEELEGVLLAMDRETGKAFPLDASAGMLQLFHAGVLLGLSNSGYGFRTRSLRDSLAKGLPKEISAGVHR